MKAQLKQFSVRTLDPKEPKSLGNGGMYIQIHLMCDATLAMKLADFLESNGVEGVRGPPEPEQLEPSPEISEALSEPDGV